MCGSQEGTGLVQLPETPEGLSCGEAGAVLRNFQLRTSEICKMRPQGMFREEAAQTQTQIMEGLRWLHGLSKSKESNAGYAHISIGDLKV